MYVPFLPNYSVLVRKLNLNQLTFYLYTLHLAKTIIPKETVLELKLFAQLNSIYTCRERWVGFTIGNKMKFHDCLFYKVCKSQLCLGLSIWLALSSKYMYVCYAMFQKYFATHKPWYVLILFKRTVSFIKYKNKRERPKEVDVTFIIYIAFLYPYTPYLIVQQRL